MKIIIIEDVSIDELKELLKVLDGEAPKIAQDLDASIGTLGLSVRVMKALLAFHVRTVRDLVNMTESHLFFTKNIHGSMVSEIKFSLAELGLTLKKKKIEEDDTDLDASITTLGLSVRAIQALLAADMKTVRDLVDTTKFDLFTVTGIAHATVHAVCAALGRLGLTLKEAEEDTETPSIEVLGLSQGVAKSLWNRGIKTISDLADRSESELRLIPYVAYNAIRSIRTNLGKFGLTLREED